MVPVVSCAAAKAVAASAKMTTKALMRARIGLLSLRNLAFLLFVEVT
jgi:hypothetical protein